MKLIENVGWTGIGMVNTVLAGFIAYSIADKPAIGAGLIGGAVASSTYAGFLGAVIAAFIAGYSVKWAKKHIHLTRINGFSNATCCLSFNSNRFCCNNNGCYSCYTTCSN